MWLAIEWLGAIVALIGSGIIATKIMPPLWGWLAWSYFRHILSMLIFY